MAYFDDRDHIECPYCKQITKQDDWYPADGDELTVECECGKDYTVFASYSIHLSTYCGNENDRRNESCSYEKALIRDKESWHDGKIYAECIRCQETAFIDPSKLMTQSGKREK